MKDNNALSVADLELTVECKPFRAKLTEKGCSNYRTAHPEACKGCERAMKPKRKARVVKPKVEKWTMKKNLFFR